MKKTTSKKSATAGSGSRTRKESVSNKQSSIKMGSRTSAKQMSSRSTRSDEEE